MSDKLNTIETNRLKKLEEIIERGQNTFMLVGKAVMEVKLTRLWRQDYHSWDEYCAKRWGWTRQRVHQIEKSSETVGLLPENVAQMVDNEKAARELANVPEDKREEVVRKAAKASKKSKATAAAIKEASEEVLDVETVFTDALGREIPDEAVEYWKRKHEVTDLLKAIKKVKKIIVDAQKMEDLMYCEVRQSALISLDSAHDDIKLGVPYAVCPVCQGRPSVQPKGECRMCAGRGLISEFRWTNVVEAKLKESVITMIQKQKEKQ